MANANINTAMLSWARERSGLAAPELAKKCGVTEERLFEWEDGKKPLTFKKAMTFAAKTHIPFGYLFLREPPKDVLPIPDLRTVNSSPLQQPSAELKDLLKLMMERQDWYSEYLKEQFSEPSPYVGRRSQKDTAEHIANDIRECLEVPVYPTRGNSENYYKDLIERIEGLGIMVMCQPNLGHHTRPLKVSEFRGFAIIDEYAPLIFINHADAPGARLFTLMHELAHIWVGESGISDGSPRTQRNTERLCNAVAAEFLVPATEFSNLWAMNVEDWRENLAPLEDHFRVSTWVLARRALTLNFISYEEYSLYIEDKLKEHRGRPRSDSGPTYYTTLLSHVSTIFSKALVSQALSGNVMLREAGWLMGGVKPAKISSLAERLGV